MKPKVLLLLGILLVVVTFLDNCNGKAVVTKNVPIPGGAGASGSVQVNKGVADGSSPIPTGVNKNIHIVGDIGGLESLLYSNLDDPTTVQPPGKTISKDVTIDKKIPVPASAGLRSITVTGPYSTSDDAAKTTAVKINKTITTATAPGSTSATKNVILNLPTDGSLAEDNLDPDYVFVSKEVVFDDDGQPIEIDLAKGESDVGYIKDITLGPRSFNKLLSIAPATISKNVTIDLIGDTASTTPAPEDDTTDEDTDSSEEDDVTTDDDDDDDPSVEVIYVYDDDDDDPDGAIAVQKLMNHGTTPASAGVSIQKDITAAGTGPTSADVSITKSASAANPTDDPAVSIGIDRVVSIDDPSTDAAIDVSIDKSVDPSGALESVDVSIDKTIDPPDSSADITVDKTIDLTAGTTTAEPDSDLTLQKIIDTAAANSGIDISKDFTLDLTSAKVAKILKHLKKLKKQEGKIPVSISKDISISGTTDEDGEDTTAALTIDKEISVGPDSDAGADGTLSLEITKDIEIDATTTEEPEMSKSVSIEVGTSDAPAEDTDTTPAPSADISIDISVTNAPTDAPAPPKKPKKIIKIVRIKRSTTTTPAPDSSEDDSTEAPAPKPKIQKIVHITRPAPAGIVIKKTVHVPAKAKPIVVVKKTGSGSVKKTVKKTKPKSGITIKKKVTKGKKSGAGAGVTVSKHFTVDNGGRVVDGHVKHFDARESFFLLQ